jgi:hypothetical protein
MFHGLEFLIFMPQPPKCWDDRQRHHTQFKIVLFILFQPLKKYLLKYGIRQQIEIPKTSLK